MMQGLGRAPVAGAVAAALWAAPSACGDGPQLPTTIAISPTSLSFGALSATAGLGATVHDQHGQVIDDAAVSWRSSAPSVATVDASGTVQSVGNGAAYIAATIAEVHDSVAVTVEQQAAEVVVTAPADPLLFASLGDTARLTAEVLDANGHPLPDATVVWSAGDAEVATVDAEGLVSAVGNGVTAVTGMSGPALGSVGVEVAQVPTVVEVRAETETLVTGDSLLLTAEARDAGGTSIDSATFEWSSSDEEIATVDSGGWVRGVDEGDVRITATLMGVSGSVDLTVVLADRVGLLALYASTGGDEWEVNDGWGTDAPLGDWHGVEVDGDGRVESLTLTQNGLVGTIAPEIRRLDRLRELHLEVNKLGGEIPPEIGQLDELEWLGLFFNELTGEIPPEIGDLGSLLVLDLTLNSLSGEVPPEIGTLAELEYLSLFFNELTGEIPPEIGDLGKLRFLDLCYNKLTGPIPGEIGDLEELEQLWLCGIDTNPEAGNRLSGTIPPELGDLAELRVMNLGANRLTGPIPPELGELQLLDTLAIYSNLLTGIPPELGDATSLEYLAAYGNRLEGEIPPELAGLRSLRTLLLGRGFTSGANKLSGEIPPELGDLEELRRLDLGANELSGEIPPELGDLEELEFLELGSNSLTGTIPKELGSLAKLTRLALCTNELSGPIPPELGDLGELYYLFLCSNGLSGPLPEALGGLTGLRFMNFVNNSLTDPMPDSMLNLSNLRELLWGSNDGLCAPRTEEFEEWLDGIKSSSDIYCEAESMPGARLEGEGEDADAGVGCTATAIGASSPWIISREHRERRSAGLARRDEGLVAALPARGATQSVAVQRGCSAARMPGEVCPRAARSAVGRWSRSATWSLLSDRQRKRVGPADGVSSVRSSINCNLHNVIYR